MIKNFLKITWRNFRKQTGNTIINITGLAIGMTCSLIIFLLVHDEFSFDRFHKDAERIYRLTLDAQLQEKAFQTVRSNGLASEALRTELPEVEAATCFRGASGSGGTRNWAVRYDDKAFNEWLVFFADSSFFDVFTCEALEGDIHSFLKQPNTIVLTDKMARKYFGNAPALGKSLLLDGRFQFMICGVVKAFPPQSHWRFDFLASSISLSFGDTPTWIGNNWNTYVKLRKDASPAKAEATFNSIVSEKIRPLIEAQFATNWDDMVRQGMYYRYHFQPITDIHLHSKLDEEIFPAGNLALVYGFIIIAIFILLIACINFMNLSTARSTRRAKEVGIRKTMGSGKSELIFQFLGEAILYAALAMIVSLIATQSVLPAINTLSGKSLSLSLDSTPWLIPGLVLFTLFVGLLAGLYPAFVLSSFQPVKVLKGEIRSGLRGGRMRSVLVTTQFVIAIVMIIGTFVVYRQLAFIHATKLGFNKEHALVVDNTWLLGNRTKAFREVMLNIPGVIAAGYTQNLPGNDISSGVYRPEGDDHTTLSMMRQLFCDFDYLSTLDVKLLEGRYFSRDIRSDSTDVVIINKKAAAILGYEPAVGRQIIGFFRYRERPLQIIGVIDDIHYEPLYLPVAPMVVLLYHGSPTRIVMRIRGDIPEIVDRVKEQWATFTDGQPLQTYFLDERLDRYYRSEQSTGKLIGIFAIVSIFISCLGLLGLSTYITEQRTKEIGVRKILGASIPGIIGLLSREFVKLVAIASVIAWPVAFYFMWSWLQNFAYHADIGWWVFVLSGGLALLIAILTVSWQAIRIALTNPVEALRYE
ncbi:ABC transporter permease [candidate division KSB1 bacterium]|nr:ABC transporter permease [candidate division KSB1 bacterium]